MRICVLLTCLSALVMPMSAAIALPLDWQQQATTAEGQGDVAKAIALYREAATEQPTVIPNLMQLGRLLRTSGRAAEAGAVYRQVIAINPSHPGALAGMAAVEAQSGHELEALSYIERAVNAGLLPGQLDALKELDSVRDTAAFKKHHALAVRYANPCRSEANYDAFDFWVGDWDVYVGGQLIARNLITKEMNGCIIHERYQTANGLIRGESINYFDPLEAKWKQNWVSATGNVIHYTGGSPRAGVMAMEGTSHAPGAPGVQLQKVTWTKDAEGGLVHSVSSSNDLGKTWTPGFNGKYVRSKRKTPTLYPDEKYPLNSAVSDPAIR